jgi:hypothetical protein
MLAVARRVRVWGSIMSEKESEIERLRTAYGAEILSRGVRLIPAAELSEWLASRGEDVVEATLLAFRESLIVELLRAKPASPDYFHARPRN